MKEENMSNELLNEYRRVAYYYYKVGLTQDAIAKKLKISRQRINRIVSACVRLGIVKITIEGLEQCNLELEANLEQKYGLREARIIDSVNEADLIETLGAEAGNWLKSFVSSGDIIGVTRGRATAKMVENLHVSSLNTENLTVTQLIGSGKESETQMGVDNMVYRLAEKLHAKAEILYAPVIVASDEAKKAYMEDVFCKETYSVMKNCTIAVVGIGTAQSQWKHMVALYDKDDAEQSRWAENVVGEVCTHFYDKDGNEVEPPFRNRIISIALKDYKNIPLRVGIAGGAEKVDAIRAALTGGYINALITDAETAKLL